MKRRKSHSIRNISVFTFVCLACFALWSVRGRAATNIVVNSASNNVANDGQCTLREAITAANNNVASGASAGECAAGSSGTDTISFNITGAGCDAGGVCTIVPTSLLPDITQPVTIDGYTQPGASVNTLAVGNNAVLKIELSGQSAPLSGLTITGGNTTVRGLAINRYGSGAIRLTGAGATGNIIAGNYVGTNAAGTAAVANSIGIYIADGPTNNRVGGLAAGEANTIAFNTNDGVQIN